MGVSSSFVRSALLPVSLHWQILPAPGGEPVLTKASSGACLGIQSHSPGLDIGVPTRAAELLWFLVQVKQSGTWSIRYESSGP